MVCHRVAQDNGCSTRLAHRTPHPPYPAPTEPHTHRTPHLPYSPPTVPSTHPHVPSRHKPSPNYWAWPLVRYFGFGLISSYFLGAIVVRRTYPHPLPANREGCGGVFGFGVSECRPSPASLNVVPLLSTAQQRSSAAASRKKVINKILMLPTRVLDVLCSMF